MQMTQEIVKDPKGESKTASQEKNKYFDLKSQQRKT